MATHITTAVSTCGNFVRRRIYTTAHCSLYNYNYAYCDYGAFFWLVLYTHTRQSQQKGGWQVSIWVGRCYRQRNHWEVIPHHLIQHLCMSTCTRSSTTWICSSKCAGTSSGGKVMSVTCIQACGKLRSSTYSLFTLAYPLLQSRMNTLVDFSS